jgi:hypothetical protein
VKKASGQLKNGLPGQEKDLVATVHKVSQWLFDCYEIIISLQVDMKDHPPIHLTYLITGNAVKRRQGQSCSLKKHKQTFKVI